MAQHSFKKNHLYFWHHTRPKALMRGWRSGLVHSISGRLPRALWKIFPRAATKPVFPKKQPLAVRGQLFLRRRTIRCLLIAPISPRRREIPMQQSSPLRPFAAVLILRLLLKHRHKTLVQR